MRYNERLPLVVWIDDEPFAWNDARAALMRNARVAIAIAPKRPDDSFWTEIRNVAWIDATRTYIVDAEQPASRQRRNRHHSRPDSRRIATSAAETRVRVRPAVVQSFAAAFIADDLKGTPPPNGRR